VRNGLLAVRSKTIEQSPSEVINTRNQLR